jgi:large subunit ribosomal protein L4
MKVDIVTRTGEKSGTIELPEKIFGGEPNKALLWEVSRMYLANRRQGTASAKKRGEVSGSGKKPWRQKHTGRARVGSIRSPVWKGGGVVHGPKPRDYSYTMPKKKKAIALASALAEKSKENLIKLIEDFTLEKPKTKEIATILKNLNLSGEKILLAVAGLDENLKRSTRNIPRLSVTPAKDLNAYDVMAHRYLVLTKKGLESLQARWQ